MIIEYTNYDISLSDDEIKEILKKLATFPVDVVSVFPQHIKLAKNLLPETIKVASCIDFPLGIGETKNRVSATEQAIKSGATIISAVAQPHPLCNRKYDKFREDIRLLSECCAAYKVELRYILEYRVFNYDLLYKVSQILLTGGIYTVYPSTGYFIDDINDNILASVLINKKVPINIVCNGNIWNISQIKNLYKINPFGISVNSLHALSLVCENKLKF